MNIFFLSPSPVFSAKLMCDKHVVKMIVESAQMLSTAHRVLNKELPSEWDKVLYKATHVNHPCNVWIRQNTSNYAWLYKHFLALGEEYEKRYNKIHQSISKLKDILDYAPKNIPLDNLTLVKDTFPECVPEKYKMLYKIDSYWTFYLNDKAHFSKWKLGRIKMFNLDFLHFNMTLRLLDAIYPKILFESGFVDLEKERFCNQLNYLGGNSHPDQEYSEILKQNKELFLKFYYSNDEFKLRSEIILSNIR